MTVLPFAYEIPRCTGLLKTEPSDFIVEEILGFPLSGEGEHWYVWVEKEQLNTQDLVKLIATHLGVSPKTITYAGLKDKQGITRQWFCIHWLNKPIPPIESLQGIGWKVLESQRHHKKLKIGYLQGNRFIITLKSLSHPEEALQKLPLIKQFGIPNYFGEQRFGIQNQNLHRASQLLFDGKRIKDRFLEGMALSAARSYIFNQILAHRIQKGNWREAIPGDLMMLAGTHSIFSPAIDEAETMQARINRFDISPVAPLWGSGELKIKQDAFNLLQDAVKPIEGWCHALAKLKLTVDYRPLILQASDLEWQCKGSMIRLSFALPAGAYATVLVRELIQTT